MNREELMREQINQANMQRRINEIDRSMAAISNFARAYMNATPEQRARVDINAIREQLERYNNLKQERLGLQDSIVANQMYFERQAIEQQKAAEQAAQRGAWQRRRRVTNDVETPETEPTPIVTGWLKTFIWTDWKKYEIQPWMQVTDGRWWTVLWDQYDDKLHILKQGSMPNEISNSTSEVTPVWGNWTWTNLNLTWGNNTWFNYTWVNNTWFNNTWFNNTGFNNTWFNNVWFSYNWEQILNDSVYNAGQTNVNPQIRNMQNLQSNWTNISSTDWVAPDTYVIRRRKTPQDLKWNSSQWRYTY